MTISGFRRIAGDGRRGAAPIAYPGRGFRVLNDRAAGWRGAPAGWGAGIAFVAAATGVAGLLRAHASFLSLAVFYLLAVLPTAVVWGGVPAVAVAVLSMFVFDFLFVPPAYAFTPADPRSWQALPFLVITAVVVSKLAPCRLALTPSGFCVPRRDCPDANREKVGLMTRFMTRDAAAIAAFPPVL